MSAIIPIWQTEAYWRLYDLMEAAAPGIDYPIAKILKTAGPDQQYIWNRMIGRHAPSNWGAAHKIYQASAKKHGIDPWGTSSTMGKPASATWGGKAKAAPATTGGALATKLKVSIGKAKERGASPVDIGFDWLKTPEGQKAMTALMHGMMKEIKSKDPKARLGFKDVKAALAKYMEI